LEVDLRVRGAIRWKHAMHLIRLQLAGIGALRDGAIPVRVEDSADRERLLAIKHGRLDWGQIDAWRRALGIELDDAFASTRLPDAPDSERVNAFLIRARRSAL
jgi:uncharacterized protein